MQSSLTFERCKGRLTLRLQAIPMGLDCCVILTGGDRPHLGATALAGRGLDSSGEVCAMTLSAMSLPGHKEEAVVREMAGRLAAVLGVNVTVCCGIHLDDISPAEIQDALTLCRDMTEELVRLAGSV